MNEVRIALRNVGKIDPMSIEDYIKAGGYKALKAARKMDRGGLIETIEETSRLRGRGGAAFPTGKKWSSAFKNDKRRRGRAGHLQGPRHHGGRPPHRD